MPKSTDLSEASIEILKEGVAEDVQKPAGRCDKREEPAQPPDPTAEATRSAG